MPPIVPFIVFDETSSVAFPVRNRDHVFSVIRQSRTRDASARFMNVQRCEGEPTHHLAGCRAGERAQLRAGYAGHITVIANQLAAAATRRPCVAAALQRHAAWQAYVVHELGPRNEAGACDEVVFRCLGRHADRQTAIAATC